MVVVIALMALLGYLYLGSILDPRGNLHDFPIAVVNQDEGDVPPGATDRQNFGDQIVTGMNDNVPKEQFDLQEMGIAAAQSALKTGDVYGAIIIPSDFTKRLVILAEGSVVPGDIEKPIITINTNPRAGTFAQGITTTFADQALAQVNSTVGEQLTKQVTEQVGDTPLTAATKLTLAEPVRIITTPYNPLPEKTGNGLSAFYYALLIVLAGFTGSMIVSQLVDSRFGFTPTEFGPWYVHNAPVGISRFHTLVVKWAIMLVLGFVVSGMYVGISAALGMPLDKGIALWLFGALAIIAVGVTATSIIALFGSAGILFNLVFFIVFGVPSVGATIPLDAQPRFFAWLAQFEPLHQVFKGVQAIQYFGASFDSGLFAAFWMTVLGLVFGLVLGTVSTRLYDRKGFERKPRAT